MGKCKCTFWKTCIPCGNRLGKVDGELSSYRIIQAMQKGNKRTEEIIDRAETWAARAKVVGDFILWLVGIWLLIWLVN